MSDYVISGVAKQNKEESKNIVLLEPCCENGKIKEIAFSTEFGDVDSFMGFEKLDIIEVDVDSAIVRDARIALYSDDTIQGIVFIKGGFLMIEDLTFFSGYTSINGIKTPYIDLVKSNIYEEEEAAEMIEEDIRFS